MKLQFNNSQYNNNMLRNKHSISAQSKYKERITQNNKEVTTIRPAQATSFGGSAVSMGQKLSNAFLENGKINKLINYISENEAGFNAAYALVVAGMFKPALVLAQTGYNDKDGQMIATKNFLQAFVGFFLGMTIGGGFIKKIWDIMSNNFNLMKVVEKDGEKYLESKSINSEDAYEIASTILKKDNAKFKNRFAKARKAVLNAPEGSKLKAFFKNIKVDKDYAPPMKQVQEKAAELVYNLRDNHLHIFNKSKHAREYTAKLIENLNFIKLDPTAAQTEIKQGYKCQPWASFESCSKNITNVPTVIAKAKISSLLLPAAVAAIFAKRTAQEALKKQQITKQDATKIAINKSKEKFKVFDAVSNPNKNKSFTASFTGVHLNKALNASTKIFEKLALTNTGEGFVNSVAKISKKPSHLMSQIESIGITIYWLLNTHFSPKIDPDQKLGLNVHTALVTIISSLASLVIDGLTDGLIDKAQIKYADRLTASAKDAIEKGAYNKTALEEYMKDCSKLYKADKVISAIASNGALEDEALLKKTIGGFGAKYAKDLSKFKSLMIFTLVVRFLVPVLTVKQSKKIKKWLLEFSKNRAKSKQEKTVNN